MKAAMDWFAPAPGRATRSPPFQPDGLHLQVQLNHKNFVSPSKTLKAAAAAVAAVAASGGLGDSAKQQDEGKQPQQQQQQQQQQDSGRASLRCSSCAAEFSGQQAAMQHAQATGHAEFSEV